MTNEEATNRLERIFNRYCNIHDEDSRCDNECNFCNRCKCCYDREAFDMAVEALEKSEKYKWHDLRKNPKDLPTKDDTYFIAYTWNENTNICYYFENCVKGTFLAPDEATVIAWQEIEPFEGSGK